LKNRKHMKAVYSGREEGALPVMSGLKLNSRKSCFGCRTRPTNRFGDPKLERHHIYSEMYFLKHGVGNLKTYKAFQRCVPLCRSCHSQISSLNSLFRQAYWKMLGKNHGSKRSVLDYEELMRIMGTIVWQAFLKTRPLRKKNERRALVQVLLKKYQFHALLALREAS
jgi:hypothetical protein